MSDPPCRIITMANQEQRLLEQAAYLLVDSFSAFAPTAWPNMTVALEEVHVAVQPDRICLAAVDVQGNVIGWTGGISTYDGMVWELHPLVVAASERGRGVGRALVQALEAQVRKRGGITLWVGTDDEDEGTSLAGVDLYPNVLDALQSIKNLKQHPYQFYQKMGFTIVGVMPDANGFGKPDIYMAKRVVARG